MFAKVKADSDRTPVIRAMLYVGFPSIFEPSGVRFI